MTTTRLSKSSERWLNKKTSTRGYWPVGSSESLGSQHRIGSPIEFFLPVILVVITVEIGEALNEIPRYFLGGGVARDRRQTDADTYCRVALGPLGNFRIFFFSLKKW